MKLIESFLKTILEVEDSIKPPAKVQAVAKDALERREKRRKETQRPGGTAVGVARARDLANGKNLSKDTVKRMRSFFARHAGNRNEDPNSPWKIAWDLWGGDSGKDG